MAPLLLPPDDSPRQRSDAPLHLQRDDDDGYVEAVGERIALLGRRRFELWAWPMLAAEDLELEVRHPGARAAFVPLLRRVHVVPEGFALELRHAEFTVWLEAVCARKDAALVLSLGADEGAPELVATVSFRPALRPMWPAGMGGQFSGVDPDTGAFFASEELGRFAFFAGAPDAAPLHLADDRGLRDRVRLVLPLGGGRGPTPVLFTAASSTPPPLGEAARRGGEQAATGTWRAREVVAEARAAWRSLASGWRALVERERDRWRADLAGTAHLSAPDARLERAFLWSKIAIERAWVDVPRAGRSLVAGLGPSHGGDRPGFAWLFSGDALTAARPLAALGDREGCRAILRWVASTQRPDGKVAHEVTLSAGLCDWFEDYPYAYSKGQCTPGFVAVLGHVVAFTGDDVLARELFPAVRRALRWCAGTCDDEGRMRVPLAGIAAVEAGPLSDRIDSEVYLQGVWVSALDAGVALATRLAEREDARAWSALAEHARAALQGFWSPARGRLAFARLRDGSWNEDLSAYAGLALSRPLGLAPEVGRSALAQNRPEVMADWGARMFATDSAVYDPEHYNTGSVFPYLTQFTQAALFRHGFADAAWQVLRSQVALDGFGGLGYLPEFLAGDRARLLPRAVPHQVFSQTTVLQGVLFGLFGLEPRPDGTLAVRASLPADLPSLALRGAVCGGRPVDITLTRSRAEGGSRLTLEVVVGAAVDGRGGGPLRVAFEPLLPPLSRVVEGRRDGAALDWSVEGTAADAPRVRLAPCDVAPGRPTRLEVTAQCGPSVLLPAEFERDAESRNPRLVGQRVDGDGTLFWTFAGRAGTGAALPLQSDLLLHATGARLTEEALELSFPAADDAPWTEAQVELRPRVR